MLRLRAPHGLGGPMKLLCVGDLHLGAGSDYGREPGERLREQAAVWERICNLAIDQDVDALLFAGDAFERRRPTPEEILAFKRPLYGVAAADIDVLAIVGNHDVEAFDRATGVELVDTIDVHREPKIWATRGVTVATLPWTPVSNLVARAGGGDRDELHARAAELLLDTARDLRAQMPSDTPAILLLHWSVSGSSLPSGLPVDGLREPVIPLDALEELGFDAIVCGHIHKAQQFNNGTRPVFYTGSPMPLNFGEASSSSLHGVWLLETDPNPEDAAKYGPLTSEFLPLESRRFVTMDAGDVGGRNGHLPCLWPDDLEVLRDAIVKVKYRATAEDARRIDHAQLRTFLYDEARVHKVYAIEATIEREARARVAGVDESIDEHQALDLWIDAQGMSSVDDRHAPMRNRHARYVEEVAA